MPRRVVFFKEPYCKSFRREAASLSSDTRPGWAASLRMSDRCCSNSSLARHSRDSSNEKGPMSLGLLPIWCVPISFYSGEDKAETARLLMLRENQRFPESGSHGRRFFFCLRRASALSNITLTNRTTVTAANAIQSFSKRRCTWDESKGLADGQSNALGNGTGNGTKEESRNRRVSLPRIGPSSRLRRKSLSFHSRSQRLRVVLRFALTGVWRTAEVERVFRYELRTNATHMLTVEWIDVLWQTLLRQLGPDKESLPPIAFSCGTVEVTPKG